MGLLDQIRSRRRTIGFYVGGLVVAVLISLTAPYQYLVYVSIVMGLVVSALLVAGLFLSKQFNRYSAIFFVGISLMVVALLNSDLPTRAILLSVRHVSLILSLVFGAVYTLAAFTKRIERLVPRRILVALDRPVLRPYNDFASMVCTALSSELCSCLHPVLALDMLGVSILVPSQIRGGFILIAMTLTHQLRMSSRSLLACMRRRPG
jgi:hypothetical protein